MLDFASLLEPLSGLGDVVAYDAPGFGRSPTPRARRSVQIEASAEIAVHVLDRYDWNDATIVGHSHGGGVAQRIARRWPHRVRSLVLLGTLGAPAHLSYRLLPFPGVDSLLSVAGKGFPKLPRPAQRALVTYFMQWTHAPRSATPAEIEEEIDLLESNPAMLRNMSIVSRGSPCTALQSEAADIEAPTLFLHGSNDRIVPVSHARNIYESMVAAGGPAKFLEVSHGGHMLASQMPNLIVDSIREFLAALQR